MKDAVDVQAARAIDAGLSSERLQVTCSEVDDQHTGQNRAERTNLKEDWVSQYNRIKWVL